MNGNFGIKGFIPLSFLDWPGKLCSVVFLGGCNFRCPACHNHKLVIDPSSVEDFPVSDILASLNRKKAWIDGVTVTGGEPTIRSDLEKTLQLLKAEGLNVKLDTNGSNPDLLEKLITSGLIDAIFMDVKAPLTEIEYFRVAGVPVSIRSIKRSIRLLKSCGLEIVFRTTVIPGLVEEPELSSIRDYLADVPRFVIQSFRNVVTLDPQFSKLEEFHPARFETMKEQFEIGSPEVIFNRQRVDML
jgi:pyruvate formate lyase activating enzyme